MFPFRIGNLAPAIIGKPRRDADEGCSVFHGFPEVGGGVLVPVDHSFWFSWSIFRQYGAIVVGMILQHDVADVDDLSGGVATKVEEEVHTFHVDTGHVALPEDVVLTRLQVNAVGEVEHTVVAIHHELHGHTVDIHRRGEDTREVVVVGSRCADVRGLEGHLCLPLVEGCLRQCNGVVVAYSLEVGICNLIPVGSIVVGHRVFHVLPHIEVAVRVEAFEGLYLVLACQDEAPCDVGSVVLKEQHHLRSCEGLDAEARFGILQVATDVGEERVVVEHQVVYGNFLSLGVGPSVAFEVVARHLLLCRSIEVGIPMSPERGARVDVSHAVGSGIVDERAALVVVSSECQAVVVNTEALFLLGSCSPPVGAVAAQFAASQVCPLAIVDAPLLASDTVEVVGPVHLGLIEGEGLGDATLADAIAVAEFHLNSIGALICVGPSCIVQRGVGRTIEDPDRVYAILLREAHLNLVHLLVDNQREVFA